MILNLGISHSVKVSARSPYSEPRYSADPRSLQHLTTFQTTTTITTTFYHPQIRPRNPNTTPLQRRKCRNPSPPPTSPRTRLPTRACTSSSTATSTMSRISSMSILVVRRFSSVLRARMRQSSFGRYYLPLDKDCDSICWIVVAMRWVNEMDKMG